MAVRGLLVNPREWLAVKTVLTDLDDRVRDNLRRRLLRTALKIERAMKKGIRDQAPGGVPLRSLKPSTIKAKGSSKALIDTGSLLRSIQVQKAGAGDLEVFVGIKRTARREDGKSQFDVALTMEFGTKDPSRIAPLPFVRPTFNAMKDEIEKDLKGAVGEAFRMST